MAFGRFKVLAGDFAISSDHQIVRDHLTMKKSGSLFTENIIRPIVMMNVDCSPYRTVFQNAGFLWIWRRTSGSFAARSLMAFQV